MDATLMFTSLKIHLSKKGSRDLSLLALKKSAVKFLKALTRRPFGKECGQPLETKQSQLAVTQKAQPQSYNQKE